MTTCTTCIPDLEGTHEANCSTHRRMSGAALSTEQATAITTACEEAKQSYREHRDAVDGLLLVIDTLVANCNDLARRYADSQAHANRIGHERDDEAEENRDLRAEVARLTAEIEALTGGAMA